MSCRGRPGRVAILALVASIAACQPLPHPFADDRPPTALLKVRDVIGVSIAPIVGKPTAVAAKLSGAVAAALLKHEIPASDKTASLGSFLLYGRITQTPVRDGNATVKVLWRLYDPGGLAIDERNVEAKAKAGEWQNASDSAIARLATPTADGLAPLLIDEMPTEAPTAAVDSHRTRVAIAKITGAPGDGAKALGDAVAATLKRQELAIVARGEKPDLLLEGEVAVAPVKADKQHVKIVWRIRRADGAEIGTVGQENDVPGGMLDGPWGDIAYSIAIAASDGLMQVIARGAPPAKS